MSIITVRGSNRFRDGDAPLCAGTPSDSIRLLRDSEADGRSDTLPPGDAGEARTEWSEESLCLLGRQTVQGTKGQQRNHCESRLEGVFEMYREVFAGGGFLYHLQFL